MAKVLVGKNFVEDAVGVPGRAATDEFAIGCSKRIKNSIVEVLVVSHEIKFIRINHIKRWSSDCLRVVWESLNATAIDEMKLRFLRLKNNTWLKLMRESCYTRYDSFGLTPRRPNYADCGIWMCNRIF